MTHHAPFSIQDIQSAVLQGREAERERIITLLEGLRDSEYAEVMTHDDLIELIKGEQ